MIITHTLLDAFAIKERNDSPGYYPPQNYLGGFYFRERMAYVAEECCKLYPGNLIEVGCYSGATSVLLAAVARKYNRKMICLDSWEPNQPWNYEEVEKAFHQTVKDFLDVIEVWKMDAHGPEALAKVRAGQWCFALSDDGHKYHEHMAELGVLLPSTTGIVVADDVYYEPDVKDAMRDSVAKNPGWRTMFGDRLREGYMTKETS